MEDERTTEQPEHTAPAVSLEEQFNERQDALGRVVRTLVRKQAGLESRLTELARLLYTLDIRVDNNGRTTLPMTKAESELSPAAAEFPLSVEEIIEVLKNSNKERKA